MKQDIFQNPDTKNQIIFFSFLYLLLLLGFFLNENSTGGAIIDYQNQKIAAESFANDFKNTFLNYQDYSTRHSPVLIIFLSFFEKINLNDEYIRFIHLHIALVLPLFFYLCLKIKFPTIKDKYIYIIVGLVFLSPTFRSLSIWPDSRILGLTLFLLSIYYLLKFITYQKYYYCILNVIFLVSSAYISPNFSLFSIYFFYIFLKFFKPFSKEILLIVLLNFLLSLPAIYYIFVLDVNFLTQTAASNVETKNILFNNYFNQLLIIPTIIFFYIFPFILIKFIKLNNFYSFNKLIFTILIFFSSIFFFDYQLKYTGGGIFLHLSNFLFKNNYIFFVISFISIYLILLIFTNKIENIIIIVLLFLGNPQITIYHKYYDPMILVLLLTIFNVDLKFKTFSYKKNIFVIYLYFLSFLLLNIAK